MRLEYFQMLDAIDEVDVESGTLVASARVPTSSPVFDGHFPGHALMPGVLLLETMAQASGYLVLAINRFSRMPFFANAKEANFRSFVQPGSCLEVRATRIHDGSGFTVTEAQVAREGKRVCDARLTLRTVAFPSPALEQYVRSEGRRLGLLDEAVA
ncbi:MAG: beta-hydroxyacyl-ACP dehydratase [Hyphomicrobium sp.]|uniref:3-hydroxyacyl-ACP dehydratase FabZ family protein n=1 Tax=Hyphomicrobium sp. TaxID=82 RepID=UPI00132AB840|nr:3-hydroxyacyl-ACP dehydratase FabZ family protein [Hyphomicrobium sp.]KAB2943142.1 MAG: beta-hydroxyacyl-ACP dehydratase [Hyphomicrobium sp.]MBZ0209036.1 beta-hydroxyacyl-ACP dehydratase [Hyphomicrobium sp.]